MLASLLCRPVGVLMSFLVLVVFSILSFVYLPVSLLPETDVPQIVTKITYPNASPAEIEQNVLRPIREKMLSIFQIKDIRSEANAESGLVELFFEQGTQMQYAYLEVNEKVDQITQNLPRDLPRPQVVRINTSDVPIIRLQVVPRQGDLLQTSELVEKVIRKRIEALEGISLVDINGLQRKMIGIRLKKDLLNALQISEKQVFQAIQEANQDLGAISVQDGQYRYFIKINTQTTSAEDLQKIAVLTAKGNVIPLKQIAEFEETTQQVQSIHLSNLQNGIVLTLHKQENAQMNKLIPQIYEITEILKQEYPFLDFQLSQNQYTLLEVGISNLQNDLLWGGLFAFVILFIFIGNYQIPFIIGVILPTSLVMSFLVFWILDTSINIVSLSGLALGLGMTIDNAIIIFDNISKKRIEGLPLFEACVKGTYEMFAPLFSSGLTTLAVFVPLVFMSGLAGAFTRDQAISVGAILTTSLLVSCILLPLLYIILFRNSQKLPKEDTRLYLFLLKVYKKIYAFLLRKPQLNFGIFLILGFLGLGIAFFLPIEGLPPIKRNDILVKINWNEPISIQENENRVRILIDKFQKFIDFSEADIGIAQFLFSKETQGLQQTEIYINFKEFSYKNYLSKQIQKFLTINYPQARFELKEAPNVFDLVFSSNKPYYEIKLRNSQKNFPIPFQEMQTFIEKNKTNELDLGKGVQGETQIKLHILEEALLSHQIGKEQVVETLKNLFTEREIMSIRSFGNIIPVRLNEKKENFEDRLKKNFIRKDSSNLYPLSYFVKFEYENNYKTLTADKTSIFHSFEINSRDEGQINENAKKIHLEAKKQNWQVDVSGQYFENRENIQELSIILLIAALLLYLILTVEFESLTQPLVVLCTLPLGFTGSLLGIWLGGATLNIMSVIGLVVMLGIIDNEAILKIDTINRLRKEGMGFEEAISKAGEICFKPVLMTSLTNILALIPFLFDTGIGGDLQRPFVLAIIGGLTFGTFTALFFVSLAYKIFAKKDT
ncbi:efflux RND transporter permease subunit [Raineya orbicola]|jgi:multidrug efflux pump subunit AcrB|uniref:AcrB/AcrD/AcrF family n=1 Tax=Raineya orbicola TaxID=2016530 RepID=A0A2N3I8Y5_9BACT|nr:efflux RND transporter permease subunit [Raineya orbicola]PKQ66749.1 AcrB/AcrD/AcrF family [Raineya orbicola]